MYKIYISGNYFYIEDTTTGIKYPAHRKSVMADYLEGSPDKFTFGCVKNWSNTEHINFSDIDLTGADYTDLTTFKQWLDDNTGNFNDPQAGGVQGLTGNIVDNTDPENPIVNENITTLTEIGNTYTYTSEDNTVTSFNVGDRYKTTSTTSNTIVGTGNLTFTVDTNLSYIPLQDVIIVYDSNNYMNATVNSYNNSTGVLVVESKHKQGSGTYSDWTINLDGLHVDSGLIASVSDDNTSTNKKVISTVTDSDNNTNTLSETVTSVSFLNNVLTYTDENETQHTVDLSSYINNEVFLQEGTTNPADNTSQNIYRSGGLGINVGTSTFVSPVDINSDVFIGKIRDAQLLLSKINNALNISCASQQTATTINPVTVLRLIRGGDGSGKFNTVLDIAIGQEVAGTTSSPKIDFRTNFAGTHNLNSTPLSLRHRYIQVHNTVIGNKISAANCFFSHSSHATSTNYAFEQNNAGQTTINTAANQRIEFKRNNAVFMRCHHTGNISIGSTIDSHKLRVQGSVAGVGAYVNLSDERHKEEIKPLNYGLNDILKLETISFKYKSEEVDNNLHLGFKAQQVLQVIPEVVDNTQQDELRMAYSELIPVLVNSVKELSAEVENLKKQLIELKK